MKKSTFIPKHFAKLLPVEGSILPGDLFMDLNGLFRKGKFKAKLFLCTTDIHEGDKVLSLLNGHFEDVANDPFGSNVDWDYPEFLDYYPNEMHTILDMNHSDYEPYRIRTDHGYGSSGRYVKILGEIDPATGVTDGMKFDPNEMIRI